MLNIQNVQCIFTRSIRILTCGVYDQGVIHPQAGSTVYIYVKCIVCSHSSVQIRKEQGSPVLVCPLQVRRNLRRQLCHYRDEKNVTTGTILNTEPAKELARLQETVGKEAHVITPPTWHAGGIEIGYHESLIGGCGGPVRITALTLTSIAIVEVHLQVETQLSTASRCIDAVRQNINTSSTVLLCRPCLMVRELYN